jgi:hypothetical protein
MTQCIMRITNPIDQDKIASSVESVGRDLLKELSSLSKGQVIISGASVNTPVMIRVRSRITKHGGQDINAPEEWFQWFEQPMARRGKAPSWPSRPCRPRRMGIFCGHKRQTNPS